MQNLPNGGGGAAPSIGPRALETLATPLAGGVAFFACQYEKFPEKVPFSPTVYAFVRTLHAPPPQEILDLHLGIAQINQSQNLPRSYKVCMEELDRVASFKT